MKILTVADVVCDELLNQQDTRAIAGDIDLIISCGDLPPEYLTSLRNRYDVPLFYVLGNHDLRYDSAPPERCIDINRRTLIINDTRITGFSGSRWYNGNINQYTEREMAGFIWRMKYSLWRSKGTDIVVTHAPPRHIKDAEDLCHRGFRSYNTFIEKYRPSALLHGHIHKIFQNDDERITRVNNTRVVNCYGYYIFEL